MNELKSRIGVVIELEKPIGLPPPIRRPIVKIPSPSPERVGEHVFVSSMDEFDRMFPGLAGNFKQRLAAKEHLYALRDPFGYFEKKLAALPVVIEVVLMPTMKCEGCGESGMLEEDGDEGPVGWGLPGDPDFVLLCPSCW